MALSWIIFLTECWKYIKMSMLLLVFCVLCLEMYTLMSVEPGWWENRHALQIVLFASPQFMRCKPIKNTKVMQWIRGHFGPLYVITVCSRALHERDSVIGILSAILAVVAATVLRPDNAEIRNLKYVSVLRGWIKSVKGLHGIFMASSFFLVMVSQFGLHWMLDVVIALGTLGFILKTSKRHRRAVKKKNTIKNVPSVVPCIA